MSVAESNETVNLGDECITVERFIQALAARDLKATVDLYAADATWEVHVPGGDGLQQGPEGNRRRSRSLLHRGPRYRRAAR
jgi:ketosteroid isomerase-like protein